MSKKIVGSLRNNLMLKLFSVLVAIVIWYVVVDLNDPIETTAFTVKISVTNESYIANGKTSFRIEDANKTVTVYVRSNRSKLKDVTAEDIVVTADLTQIVNLESDPVMVPLFATCEGINTVNLTLSKSAIPIVIETISSKEFAVVVDTGDTRPGNNYEVGESTPDPDTVVIHGLESVVNSIDSVIATIDVTGMTRDGSKKAVLKLLDKNQNELSKETINDDLTFDGGLPEINVAVDIWEKRSDVAIEVDYSGQPENGYHITSIKTTPETLTVVGNDEALSQLSEAGNKIVIPAELISVEGARRDVVAEIPADQVLPENLRTAESSIDNILITLKVLSDETKEIGIDVDQIETSGLGSNYTISYDQSTIGFRIKGIATVLDQIKDEDIHLKIDLSSYKTAGDYTVPVQVTLPSGVTLGGDAPSISVHIKEKAESASGKS